MSMHDAGHRSPWAIRAVTVLTLAILVFALPAAAQDVPEAFEVPAFTNAAAVPPDLDRSTPRASVEGFIDAADRGDEATAALYLYNGEAAATPEDARRLREVIRRKIWIDWASLPDREDGLEAFASSETPEAGEPRRSLRFGVVDAGDRPVEFRINRYQPEGGEPVWLISDRTLRYLPALYEEHGAGSLEARLPDSLTREAFWSMPLWQIIAAPLFLLVAGLAGFVVYRIVRWIGRRLDAPLTEASGIRWVPQIVSHSAMPVALFVAASLVAFLQARFLTFSGPANIIVSSLITILLVISVALILLRIVNTILDIVTSNFVSAIDDEENSRSRELFTNISVARRIIILVALLVGAAVVVAQLNLSQSLGISLLASAGVVTLILGFAAQTVLGNILASIQIAIAKPIRIGDAVVYEGEWGYIEEINFTYVLIRTWDYRRLIVPVRTFVSDPIENWSMRDAGMIAPIELKLDPTADIESLRAAYAGMLEGNENWDRQQEPKVLVVGHDERAITVRFYSSAKNPSAAWDLHCALREALFAYLRDEEGGRWLPRERQQMLDVEGRPTLLDAEALRAGA